MNINVHKCKENDTDTEIIYYENINEWEIAYGWAYCEYINFCPFCGKKLNDKKHL